MSFGNKIKRGLKKFNPKKSKKLHIASFVIAFAAIGGIITLLLTAAAVPIRVDTTLPQVRNLKAFGDDRVITVTWDAPQNAEAAGIVGYFVEYGETALGTFPYTKQTTYNSVQLQPIENGKQYSIRVYAAHGSTVQVPTPNAHDSNSAPEKRGSGRVAPAVATTATPVSTRVDQLRQRMTGFFDDFNTPAGPFDELKWNQAGSSCGQVGTYGAFVNNQHHSHNQVSTIPPTDSDEYCDRGQMATRARGIFDIAGRTDADPGEIVFDMDGASRIETRAIWYLDLIPVNARNSGAPVDVTAHASLFDDEASDPSGIRIAQDSAGVVVHYYDTASKTPRTITPTFTCQFDYCNAANKVAGLSPIAEQSSTLTPMPNVRRHWVVRMTTSKMTIFVDSVRVWEGAIPADFRTTTKYQMHSTIFGYNTGKDNPNNPKTFLFHWDNFGFNGPAAPTVTHNYVEGGATGLTPYLGRGTLQQRVPKGPRTTIIPIPDTIGSPSKARVMFTVTAFGPGWYDYNAAHGITVNGKNYPLPHPRTMVSSPAWSAWNGNTFYNGNSPMSLYIDVNPADLVRGNNQVRLNIDGHHQAVMNVHIELEYARGSQPTYTQPKAIFGTTVVDTFNIAPLDDHDKYLYVEQNLGLTSAEGHGNPTPQPTPDTQAPTVTLTDPVNNHTLTGNSVVARATATDNTGVTRVEFYVGTNATPVHTDTTAASGNVYDATIDFTSYAPGTYPIRAIAYDASGNVAQTSARNVIKPQPADTTAPTVSLTSPANNFQVAAGTANLTLTASATDNVGVTRVEFWVDGTQVAAKTSATSGTSYTHSIQTGSYQAGNHSWYVIARDAAGNIRSLQSGPRTFVIPQVTPTPNPEPEPTPDPVPDPTPTPNKPGDIDGNGRVDRDDLRILLFYFGRTVSANTNGDLNNDGRVNRDDLRVLLFYYLR